VDAIESYYCPVCVANDPGLKTIYKRTVGSSGQKADRSKGAATSNSQRKRASQTAIPSRPAKKSKVHFYVIVKLVLIPSVDSSR